MIFWNRNIYSPHLLNYRKIKQHKFSSSGFPFHIFVATDTDKESQFRCALAFRNFKMRHAEIAAKGWICFGVHL